MQQLRQVSFFPLFLIATLICTLPVVAAPPPPKVTIEIVPGDGIFVDMNGDFVVPKSTVLDWEVHVVMENPLESGEYKNLVWTNFFDAALDSYKLLQPGLIVGSATFSFSGSLYQPHQVHWTIQSLGPGQTASLIVGLKTRSIDGVQMYSELGCGMWDAGAELHYELDGEPGMQGWPPRRRCVVEAPPWITISFAPRKDWHLRQPGCFASEAFVLELASNSAVSVSFDEFANLERLDDPFGPAIPAWYARGEEFVDAVWDGWFSAADFNDIVWEYAKSPALESGISETVWSQVCIGPEHAASEYEDLGLITIVVDAGSPHIENRR